MSQDPFYLVGDFNNWQPETCRFHEVTFAYGQDELGQDHPHVMVETGSYYLEMEIPRGCKAFKIVQGCTWDHQWSVDPDDHPEDFTKDSYLFPPIRRGLQARHIHFCGPGMPPHAEFPLHGPARLDFHPASRTVIIHNDRSCAPGPTVFPWREFRCTCDAVFSTWVCLPYGYKPAMEPCPVVLILDGRELLYGEDLFLGTRNDPKRQVWRVFDTLSRTGLVPPCILVGLGVPRYPALRTAEERLGRRDRATAYCMFYSDLHKFYLDAIVNDVIAWLGQDFPPAARSRRYIVGHSNGGDFALRALATHPELFWGAISISPSGALTALGDARKLCEHRRIAISFGVEEPGPTFRTESAALRALSRDVLVVTHPLGSHDPASMFETLFSLVAFVVS